MPLRWEERRAVGWRLFGSKRAIFELKLPKAMGPSFVETAIEETNPNTDDKGRGERKEDAMLGEENGSEFQQKGVS